MPRRKEREARMEVERASSPEFEEERTKMETVKTVSYRRSILVLKKNFAHKIVLFVCVSGFSCSSVTRYGTGTLCSSGYMPVECTYVLPFFMWIRLTAVQSLIQNLSSCSLE